MPQTKIIDNKTTNETDLIMNTNLKVLVIAQYFPPDMGGGSTRHPTLLRVCLPKVAMLQSSLLFRIIHTGKCLCTTRAKP